MRHGNDYWEQEAYWELERRRVETSAMIGGICFLLLLAVLLSKVILGGGMR